MLSDKFNSESKRYQFSGYNLPLLQWDETGPAWIKLSPHPYLRNQPPFWQSIWSFGLPPYSFVGGNNAGSSVSVEENECKKHSCDRMNDMLSF